MSDTVTVHVTIVTLSLTGLCQQR